MAEPTSTTATAWAVAAGAIGAFFAAIGVGWADVFWAVLGTMLGGPVANSLGRWRAMVAFPASAMLAAKFGVWGGGAGRHGWRQWRVRRAVGHLPAAADRCRRDVPPEPGAGTDATIFRRIDAALIDEWRTEVTTLMNAVLFLLSVAAMGAYYCRIDALKYGIDPLGRILAHFIGGAAAAWSMSQSAQMKGDWTEWLSLVVGLMVLVSTYRYVGPGQVQRAKLARVLSERGSV